MKKYYLINQEVYPVSTPEEGIRIFMDDPFTHGLSIDEFKKVFKKNQERLGIKVPATALQNNTSFWNHMIKTKLVTLATPTEKKLLNNESKPQRAKKISGIASSKGIKSTPKRKWSVEDPVLFRGKVWYLRERNGAYGLVNFSRTVTGDFIPLWDIKYPEITTITDMYGKPVDVNRNLSKVPVGNVKKKPS